ncbi:MAG: sulfatase [Alphaproteobacteria bacterium]|nr:sulfatase [Alphaproteobacteria bacterium]
MVIGLLLALGVGCGGAPSPAEPAAHVLRDLVALRHLAEVDEGGWVVDVGSPAGPKHTLGGWTRRPDLGDGTWALADPSRDLVIPVDASEVPTSLRLRVHPGAARAVRVQLDEVVLPPVPVTPGGAPVVVEVPLPEGRLRAPFTALRVGGEDASAAAVPLAVDWLWLRRGAAPAPEVPTTHDRLGRVPGALQLAGRSTLRVHLVLPPEARLQVGVRAVDGSVPFRVRLTPDGGEARTLHEGVADGEVASLDLSLGAPSGTTVRLELEALGDPSSSIRWEAPCIVVAPRPAPDLAPARGVVLVVVDTLGAARVHAVRPATRVRTPALDALAAGGVLFAQARSPESWTKPAVASLLTGLHPDAHGQTTPEAALPPEALLLAEHLQAQGFATAALTANPWLTERFGFDQGWDTFQAFPSGEQKTDAATLYEAAGDWLEAHAQQRFFLYVQPMDPHDPYAPDEASLALYDADPYDGPVTPEATSRLLTQAEERPPAFTFSARDARRLEALHDGEITQHDGELGRFLARLEALGLADDTLVVLTADHGEEFGEHGGWRHGTTLYDEVLHVPLLLRLPGRLPAGGRVEEVVSTVAVPSTLTELLAVPPLPGAAAASLVGRAMGLPGPAPPGALSANGDRRHALTSAGWKVIAGADGVAEVHDLRVDPGEQQPVDAARQGLGAWRARLLLGQVLGAHAQAAWWTAEHGRGTTLVPDEAPRGGRVGEALRELGYTD